MRHACGRDADPRCARWEATRSPMPRRTSSRTLARVLADPGAVVSRGARACARFLVGTDGTRHRPRVSRGARVKVAAVVISHGHAGELARSLPVLGAQVDDVLLIVATSRGAFRPELPAGVRVLENERPLSFAANANSGRGTEHPLVLVANPDVRARARRGRDASCVHGSPPIGAGVAGPKMLYADGTWQASRRSFPDRLGHARAAHSASALLPPSRWQRRHYR